ncbi:MAG: major facilitator superfamily domain-containing protein [Benniella sp.]|nr:MAG: major facilitator superfamily domain-containing protein [Benniella sp.]
MDKSEVSLDLHQDSNTIEEQPPARRRETWSRILITSSTGFFTDAYDIFIINLIVPMLGYVYYKDNGYHIPAGTEGALKGMASFGSSVIQYLTFWRFVIGGDHPMSATVTSEWSSAGRHGELMAAIFSMQGIGNLTASIITLIILACFKSSIISDVDNLDIVWRICISAGSKDVEKNAEKAKMSVARATDTKIVEGEDIPVSPKVKRAHHREFALGRTSKSWFLLDVVFYGISLNQRNVLNAMGFVGDGTTYDNLWRTTLGNLTVSCLGFVPGYNFSVFLIEKMGRKRIQFMGFGILTILFIILAATFHPLRKIVPLFIVILTLAQFFFNFGPNTITFVVPREIFPTRMRTTAHGISAASGKLGAILATFGFNKLVEIGGKPGEHAFLPKLLVIFAGSMALGFLFTFFLPETKGMSLEELEQRDVEKANGRGA